MKLLITFVLFFSTTPVLATESEEFCKFLLSRAQIDSQSLLKGKDGKAKLDEIQELAKVLMSFVDKAKEGIDKKMSWQSFKKDAEKKGTKFSDYFQPQYDQMYLEKYCGSLKTEASIKIDNGVVKEKSSKTKFEKTPNPSEHEYSKQMGGTK